MCDSTASLIYCISVPTQGGTLKGIILNRDYALNPTYKVLINAAFAYLDAPNVAMLTEMGIYTEEELKSRFEIILENYAKTVRIEASTALLMAKTEIYPAVLNELKDKSELLNNLHNLSLNDSYIFDDLQNYNALIAALKAGIDSLQADLNKYNELTSIKDKAAFAVEKLNKDLAQIRNSADLLEDETAKNKWPIPNYVDLIFAL